MSMVGFGRQCLGFVPPVVLVGPEKYQLVVLHRNANMNIGASSG